MKFREPVYVRVTPAESLPDLKGHAKFRAVVILEDNYPPEWQAEVSRWLVAGGCLAMMAWGPNCSSWDDSVDVANCEAFDWSEIPDEAFVMTTWHENETLESVFWFCQFCAEHPDYGLEDTLLIHVSRIDRREEFKALFMQSRDLAERDAEQPPSTQ